MVNAEDLKEIWEKAPDFAVKQNSIWRDADKQKEADRLNVGLVEELKKRNIVLA